jgi:flagellar motor switch protein FliM
MSTPDRREDHPGNLRAIGITKRVQPCNFRMAGRLSNEDTRSLMAVHESFGHQLADALELYLSVAVEVELLNIDQMTLKEHLECTPFLIVPLSLGTFPGHPLIEFDERLALTFIEVLMGGSGEPGDGNYVLSEIDKEIMSDVIELVAAETERAWRIPGVAVTMNAGISPEAIHRFCSSAEKLTVLYFGIKISSASSFFKLVLPASFVTMLLKQVKLDQPQKRNVWQFPKIPIRERLLDCDLEVSAELLGLRVAVRDLVALQPGSVLKLRAPIQTPGMLTAGNRPIFEAVPVRNGSQRAAQLGKRIAQFEAGKVKKRNG